jgi:hypothetical protein
MRQGIAQGDNRCDDEALPCGARIRTPARVNGLELAQSASAERPSVALLVTWGNRALALSPLPPGTCFLPKPYDLAHVVGQVQEMPQT